MATLPLIVSIGGTAYFTDVELSHVGGVRRTRVHHECPLSPYSLPYTAYEPSPANNGRLTRAALLRAVRYCNHAHDYDEEKKRIRFSLQLNRVPLGERVRAFDAFDDEFPAPHTTIRSTKQDAYEHYRTSVCASSSSSSRRNLKQAWKRRWQNESSDHSGTSPCKRIKHAPL
jgi:hypothetical protein